MCTSVRANISEKNKYWISKHRYYELKHFCLQYRDWKKAYAAIGEITSRPFDIYIYGATNIINDPTAKCAEARIKYSTKINMVHRTASNADPDLSNYILKAVTEGVSYEYLKTKLNMPCSRDTYYDRYRRFFWLLDKEQS